LLRKKLCTVENSVDNLFWCSNLTEVGQHQFGRLVSLEQLHLDSNSIHLLQPAAFQGLESLQFLSLASNNIKTLQEGVFTGQYILIYWTVGNNVFKVFKDYSICS
jgi:hypothetical protein